MSEPLTSERLFEAIAREMATAVAALLGESTDVQAGPAAAELAWHARITAGGELAGTIELGLSEADGRRISALIMGFEGDDVPDEAVVDTLREICAQAVGALSQAPDFKGVSLSIDAVARDTCALRGDAYVFALPGGVQPAIVVTGDLTAGPAHDATPRAMAVPVAHSVAPAVTTTTGNNLDLLLDIELPLAVRFGQTEMTLSHLTRLGPGSVIDLHRSADEPVEVLVSGKVIARGEVVVVEGNYGVRVTEVVSTADRIRSLGA
jgi:flagellar motor switch protein FliN/FliY